MAAFIDRWLAFTVMIPLIVFNRFQEPADSPLVREGWPHPYHVSVVEINHNSAEKTMEITCKLFTDDFESILSRSSNNVKVDLINSPDKSKMDSLVKKYVLSHLAIKVNDKPVYLDYLGYENDQEAVYSYIEGAAIPAINKLEITNSLLYDLFDDQIGIIHIIVNGKRQSLKISYPDKTAVFRF